MPTHSDVLLVACPPIPMYCWSHAHPFRCIIGRMPTHSDVLLVACMPTHSDTDLFFVFVFLMHIVGYMAAIFSRFETRSAPVATVFGNFDS